MWSHTSGQTPSGSDPMYQFNSSSTSFKWKNYRYLNGSSFSVENLTKYAASENVLEISDDAARYEMGGTWHMPTDAQFRELVANTNNEWVSTGTQGIKFISKTDSTKYIFIPMGGAGMYGQRVSRENVRIWCNTAGSRIAYNFNASSSEIKISNNIDKCLGLNIRGVIDQYSYDINDPVFGVLDYTYSTTQYNYEYKYENIIYALTHPNQPGIIIIDNDENEHIKSGDSR